MARQETILNVFLSSPSDVAEDRDTVEEIIEEVNRSLSANTGVRFVTLRWETSVTPGIGADPQSVINAAIGGDYDVFVGIMGSRFGQTTPRFGSGTEEEFSNAYEKHLKEPNSLRVLFYFKDVPVHPSKIDPKQLSAVNEFKAKLNSKGVLYASYTTRDEFQKLLRIHFSEILQNWAKKEENRTGMRALVLADPQTDFKINEEEEPGILDLLADIQDDFESLNSIAGRLTESTNTLTVKMKERAGEFEAFGRSGSKDFRHVKRICAGTALDMDEYCTRTEPELNLFPQTHARLMDRTIRIVSLLRTDGSLNQDELGGLRGSLATFADTLAQVRENVQKFRNNVAGLPRATIVFNKSRNRTVRLVDRLVEMVDTGKKLTSETERLIAGISP